MIASAQSLLEYDIYDSFKFGIKQETRTSPTYFFPLRSFITALHYNSESFMHMQSRGEDHIKGISRSPAAGYLILTLFSSGILNEGKRVFFSFLGLSSPMSILQMALITMCCNFR